MNDKLYIDVCSCIQPYMRRACVSACVHHTSQESVDMGVPSSYF